MPSEMEMQQALEDRMRRLLEHASQAKVAKALGVTRTTVNRWAHGAAVTPGAVTRVQSLLRPDLPNSISWGKHEEAPSEEGAVERFFKRWDSDEPPPWAAHLTLQLMELIRQDRQQTVEQAIQSALDRAVAATLGSPLPDEEAPGSEAPPPSTPAGRAARRP